MWQHYCKGELKGTTMLGPALECHDEEEEQESCHLAPSVPSCPLHAAMATDQELEHHMKSDCCSDELDLSKLAQLQQVVEQPDWELNLAVAILPAEVQTDYPLLLRGEKLLLPQQERPPPIIPSGREIRIRLASFLC